MSSISNEFESGRVPRDVALINHRIETCQQFYLQSTDENEKKAIEGLDRLVNGDNNIKGAGGALVVDSKVECPNLVETVQ